MVQEDIFLDFFRRMVAGEIFNLINLPSAVRVEHFANGKASLVEVEVQKGCALIGESLHSLGRKLSAKALICAVQRGNQIVIPSGDFVIQENDKLHFTSDVKNLGDFLREAGLVKSPIKKVMIVGGGRIGFYLADMLSKKKYKVKLIELDMEKAKTLAENLPNVTVCCGNGTSHEFLLEEGIEATDAFAALTDIDEENTIVAKFEGKPLKQKTIDDVFVFITLYFFILIAALFLLGLDPVNGQMCRIVSDAGSYTVKHGFFSNFSAVLTCISNVGPAFEAVGPYSNFAAYSGFSKIVLTLTMLLGRLEILPVLILFSRRTWKKM